MTHRGTSLDAMEVAGDAHYPDPPLTRLVLGLLKGEVITGGGERHYCTMDSFVWGCHVVQMGPSTVGTAAGWCV